MNESPIFYMGNKRRLIKKGLIDLFPKNIETFYDLFCGSGVVSMNVDAIYYELNDINQNVIDLLQMFCFYEENPQKLINLLEEQIYYYGLHNFSIDNRKYKGDISKFKLAYKKLRDDYNKTKKVELLYLLNIFCNSHMIRFNSKNEFNMPIGNSYFKNETKDIILQNNYSRITYLNSKDFRCYKYKDFNQNDFIYLDPPYIGTNATYNENGGWTEKDDNDLLEFCNHLNNKGIKFGLSNVFKNKNFNNIRLQNFVKDNNYNVYYFDNFSYYSNGKGDANTIEVFVTNY